jgi:sulfofructose kinase
VSGGKIVASDYFEVGGGPAATAAVVAARLGADVDIISRVGDDSAGVSIIKELRSYGVNTDRTRVFPGARSSQSAILVDNEGERVIINHPSPDLSLDASWMSEIDFEIYDMVLVDVRWHEGAQQALTLAGQHQVPTLLDGEITPQDITTLVTLSNHAVFSEPGLLKATGSDSFVPALRCASSLTDGSIYVTRGADGCYWLDGETLRHQPGFFVDIVDTTGAGDVFHGALAYALVDGQSVEKAVQFANAVAALKCTKPGGRAGIPDIAQVSAFLASRGE